jgi:hypothetical protein
MNAPQTDRAEARCRYAEVVYDPDRTVLMVGFEAGADAAGPGRDMAAASTNANVSGRRRLVLKILIEIDLSFTQMALGSLTVDCRSKPWRWCRRR